MFELETALARILAAVPAPVPERVPLADAYGRVLSETVRSPVDLPGFDNSSMDGYAVRAADVAGGTADTWVQLRVTGKVAAGQSFRGVVEPGTCVRLFTGSPLPRGADAVVAQEDTRATGADHVAILGAAKPWENVRFRGEDVKAGATLVSAGDRVTAGRLSLLAAAGVPEVVAGRRPVVALLATGSEIRTAGSELAPGQVYESNRLGLAALAANSGGLPRVVPLVPDDLDATRRALAAAFTQADIVVSSGGVSVGEMDFIKPAFDVMGGTLEFWRVAIKPGRPFVFGRRGERLLFGLPGNPVSAFVTFLLLVRPALLRWQGATEVGLPSSSAVLAEPLANPGGRRHFVRVRVDAAGAVYSAGEQGSHRLSSLAAANGLVDLPPASAWPAGTTVRVMRWE